MVYRIFIFEKHIMAISMDDVNTLIWRYLSESGFQHSAFIFQSESMVKSSDSFVSQIPSGSLISLLQKSLLYMKLEKIVKTAKNDPNHSLHNQISEIEKNFPDLVQYKTETDTNDQLPFLPRQTVFLNIPSPQISTILRGHSLCVFGCAWSPNGNLLATASADGTAIIWTITNGNPIEYKVLGVPPEPISTEHGITTIDWESSGRFFATGSFDTFARIYTSDGQLYLTLQGHQHNVFAVRFNPSGNFIVTCSADHTAILWEVLTGKIVHIFGHHTDTILDVSWKNNQIFATASADNTIGICNVNGSDRFLRGHECHVTAVSWSPDGSLLASASEDNTVRIWSDNAETKILRGHKTGVSCVKWASATVCVSSSQDGAVRVWNAIEGICLHCIERHTKDVISLSVSPCGEYVASGSTDETIDISRIKTGERIAMISGRSPIFEVQWHPSGKYLAVCFDDSTVAIVPSDAYMPRIL
ncbi:F-box-like/WD repeat-containing protein TBL1XR1-B [Tritrichomonas foetus]|uniref:F-box-like/WD repeat-containing protein TBL1XR1-B n=1 Tax=Tritrichomonas foetus TaxID=1144522 RepID=A0A1J4KVN7_9EUKA|nr:F-box-like/WD repeat-containing protein TBL1XR1-B [Tritrichomonas foetus]|eukprot:OHT13581.1 F-box-like/WD repeat-containing protein TBL1XR1-B [Tritrichomonas foetus]